MINYSDYYKNDEILKLMVFHIDMIKLFTDSSNQTIKCNILADIWDMVIFQKMLDFSNKKYGVKGLKEIRDNIDSIIFIQLVNIKIRESRKEKINSILND